MKKRVISFFLVLCMLVSLFPVGTAFADSNPQIVVSTEKATAGEEVTLSVSTANNPGISVLALGIDYDKTKLEYVGFEDSGFTDWTVKTRAVWLGNGDSTYNGEILKLKFKVLSTAAGMAAVSVSCGEGDAYNYNEEPISFKTVSGGVDITEAHKHSYITTAVAPTCMEKGYTLYVCACGDSYKDSFTDSLGHSFENGVCTRCGAVASGSCGAVENLDSVKWLLDKDGTLIISGDGDMANYSESKKAPWYEKRELVKSIVIESSVTSIGDYAFDGCSNASGSLMIPDEVTSIGKYAFRHCCKLTSLVIGEKVESIDKDAFYADTNEQYAITEITFKGTTAPKEYGFLSKCNSSLKKVFVPEESYDAYVDAYSAYINHAEITCKYLEAAVKGLKVTNRYDKTIALSWQSHISDKVIGYVVTRDGEVAGRTDKCAYVDRDISSGEHTYEVYGYTADDKNTAAAVLTASTAKPELIKLYSNHLNNTVAVSDGKIYINAKNNDNFNDLDGNEIQGKLYYINSNGDSVLAGTSKLMLNSTATSTLVYCVDWDVEDIAEGEYTVIFAIEDPDRAKAEIKGTVNVIRSAPEKIVNFIAVGDFEKVNLSWSQSSEVDTTIYKIYRKSEADSEFKLIKTINGRTTLSCIDTDIEEAEVYSYYIVAENSFGMTSEPSEIANASLATDAEAPTVTKFAPASGTYITGVQTVTVSAVDNIAPTKIKLFYSENDGESWTSLGEDVAAPFVFSFDTRAIPDGKVILKAYAYDAKGNESLPLTCIYYIDNTGPEKVKGLSAKSVLSSKITLEWEDVSDNDAAYFVLQQKKEGSYVTVASSITTLGYNLSGLYAATEYTYRVAAVDIRGNVGDYSDDFTVTTLEDTTAPVVTSLAPNPSRYNNSINFMAGAADDCAIKSITIQASTDRKTWVDVSTAKYTDYIRTATFACTISLADYSDGSIFVRAVAEDFSGNISDTTDAAAFVEYIVDKTSPDKPRDLIASGGDGWIYVSWLQGDENDIASYQLYRATSEEGPYSLIASDLTKISYYDTSAQRDTVYYYKLRGLDTTGNLSEFSEAVSAKVADDVTAPEVVSINPANGSVIGPEVRTVQALVKDNNCIDSITFEYKVNDAAEYKVLKVIENVGYYYTVANVDLPVDEFSDGDKITIRVSATDIVGLTSEYSSEYIYDVDKVAPSLSNLEVTVDRNDAVITWQNGKESDISGYKIYRVNDDEAYTILGSRPYSETNSYSFRDYLYALGDGDYSYKVEVYDKVGNYNSFFTEPVHYEYEAVPPENQAPVAKIDGFSTMEIGVEEYFDAGYSTDDKGIVSYHWDFGDGTSSDEIKPIKKFKQLGVFTVKLTVTDTDGVVSSDTLEVTVNERSAVGTVKVNVVDENGKPVANAPVYFDLGANTQKKINTDKNGAASMLMSKGDHEIGVYKNGYLPVQKTVTVLPNATRIITVTVIQQELVTGEFDVKRMTFNEIKAAGIDVDDPANQNVYKVNVTIRYGDSEIPVTYIRNNFAILNYTIGRSGGDSGDNSGDGFGDGSGDSSGSNGRDIAGLTFIGNSENVEIIAVLDMPIEASYLKEFFDVRLHIINNAAPQFKLTDSKVHIDVPDGMTMMTGVSGDWNQSADVNIGTINGQETKTLAWILRGDKEGSYDLEADYSGTLAVFDEPVSATFKTDKPIKVYGLKDFKMVLEVNKEITYNAFYFNIGLENNGTVDMYNPKLNFDGIVSNITASAKSKEKGSESENEDEDFDILSALLNVRYVHADGSSTYIPFSQKDGKVLVDVDTLAPGEAIYYEYAAYNMINYDGTGYFVDAATEQLSEYAGSFEGRVIEMGLYNTANAINKLEAGLLNTEPVDYLTNNKNYYYYATATGGSGGGIGRTIYNCADLILNFNWDVISKEDREELADSIILQILLSQDAMSNIDDKIDEDYVTAVKSYLSNLKSQLSIRLVNYDEYFEMAKKQWDKDDFEEMLDKGEYPVDENGELIILDEKGLSLVYDEGKAQLYQIISIVDDIAKNYKMLDELAKNMKNGGPEVFRNQLFGELCKIGGAVAMERAKWEVKDLLEDSLFISALSDTCKYTTKLLDYAVLNPIKAINQATYNQAIYYAVQTNAAIEEEMLIVNTIIEYCDELNSGEEADFSGVIKKVAKKYKEIIAGKAYDFEEDVLNEFKKVTFEGVAKDGAKLVASAGLKAISNKVSIVYALVSTTFGILDEKLKWGENFKCQDKLDIAECLSTIFLTAWKDYSKKYENDKSFENANRTIHMLKYLSQTRLIGESHFKSYISNIDEGFINQLNKDNSEKGLKQYKDVEELYDEVYKNILTARDNIFNHRTQTNVVKPSAPTVTFNYDTMTTNESFDDSYEYCLSDGEWRSCSGGKISVELRTTGTVLRVRAASGNGTPAGEITTVNIFAQREFSKVVSVKYDEGTYYFNNLVSTYDYQICPVDTEYATPDWSKATTVKGSSDASVKASYAKYLAIRTCGNASLKETVSKYAILPVQTRQELTLNIWGNGEVAQSNESGKYFVGDDIKLTATPKDGASFRGWFADGELVSRDPEYILEMFGNAEITAKFEGGEEAEATSIELATVNTTDDETVLYEGASVKLKAIIYPLNTTDKTVKWTSSDDDIATVAQNGVVSFVKSGDVTITAETVNGIKASHSFTVAENTLIGISIAEKSSKTVYYEYERFDKTGLKVIAKYLNGKAEEITDYTVSGYNTEPGEKYITVSYGDFSEHFGIQTIHKTSWQEETASTCTEHGTEAEVCDGCGSTMRTRQLPLKEHSYEWVVSKPATVDEDGLKEYVCKNCGDVAKSEVLKYCEHSYTKVVTDPTCEKEGYTTYTCTKCGYEYVGDRTEALQHNYTDQVVEPICERDGYTLHRCTKCGDSYITDRVEALSHSYTETVVAPTCTEEGYTLHTCKYCEDSYKTDITDIIPHSYTSETVAATCEHGGYTAFTCDICGASFKSDITDILPHNYTQVEKNGNCVQGSYIEKTCTECGKVEIVTVAEPTEHVYGEWCIRKPADEDHTGIKYRTCAKCGYEDVEIMPVTDHQHVLGDWCIKQEPTCEMYGIKERVCTKCNEVVETEVIAATGHDYELTVVVATCTEDGYTLNKCKNCEHSYKDNVQPALKHVAGEWVTLDEATCTEDGLRCKYCTVCQSVVEQETIPATSHANRHWEIITQSDCVSTGLQKQYCDDCGKCLETKVEPSLGHKYSTVKTAADCLHDGIIQYKCMVCGQGYEEKIENALGHDIIHHDGKTATCAEKGWAAYDTCSRCDYSTYKEIPATGHHHNAVVTAPSCTEKGYTTHTCTCGDSYVDSYTDALGHSYGAWKQTKAPTCTAKGAESRSCTRCNASETRDVASLGHDRIHHAAKAATCTEKGWAAYDTCSRCNYSTYKEIAATGHKHNAVVTAPTCTAQGYTTHTCSSCGNSYKDSYTNALGHNYANGKCTRCGAADPNYNPTPAAPELKITTVSGKPKISWNAVDGAAKYWVYRSTDGKTFKYYDSTTKTSYTNNSTTIGTTYYYKVKAVNVVDGKNYASAYSVSKGIQCKPAAPTVSINRSNGKPKLSWKAVSGATKYWIYRSTDGVNFKYWDSTTKTSYTNSGAESGKKYYYRVKAVAVVNGKNIVSANSSTKSLFTSLAKPSVSITTSNGKPKITWKAVTGADKYYIYRSTDGKNFSYWDSTTKTTYVNSGAKKNTKYYYKVKAVCASNSNANSAQSSTVSIKATK